MKKLILVLMSFTIVLTSYSQTNPFQKNKDRNAARAAEINKHTMNKFPIPILNSGNANVAQLMKQSSWDAFANIWIENSSSRNYYVNDRLIKTIYMSYDYVDTIHSIEYYYDANGRYSVVELKKYNQSTHKFESDERYTFTYYANNSSVSIYELFNSTSNTWEYFSRNIIKFDSRGNLVQYKVNYYDGGLWNPSYSYGSFISYYGNTALKVIQVDSFYVDTLGAMAPNYKSEKTYGINSEAVEIIHSNFYNGIETIEEIDSIFYDSNSLPVTLVVYSPSMNPKAKLDNINWTGRFNSDIDIFYNELLNYTLYKFLTGNWVLTYRYSTTFPDNNGSKIKLKESYDSNVFTPVNRSGLIYDVHKNIIEDFEEVYNLSTSSLEIIFGRKYNIQYDMNNNISENIFTSYSISDTAYVNQSKEEYFEYISIAAGVNSSKKTIETKLYPNPSNSGKVYIDLNLVKASSISIEIIDINGRIVNVQHQELGQGLNTVELNGLNKGMYFVIITSDYGVSRTKLIVK